MALIERPTMWHTSCQRATVFFSVQLLHFMYFMYWCILAGKGEWGECHRLSLLSEHKVFQRRKEETRTDLSQCAYRVDVQKWLLNYHWLPGYIRYLASSWSILHRHDNTVNFLNSIFKYRKRTTAPVTVCDIICVLFTRIWSFQSVGGDQWRRL